MMQGKTWMFLEVPKTGSTSAMRALRPFGKEVAHQHKIPDFFDRPIVACVVRNTYDRATSAWRHVCRRNTPFDQFLMNLRKADRHITKLLATPQWEWAQHCNLILRYEDLDRDWEMFCEEAGIPHRPLPMLNKSRGFRGETSYRDLYNGKTRGMVEEIFAKDLEVFKHQF